MHVAGYIIAVNWRTVRNVALNRLDCSLNETKDMGYKYCADNEVSHLSEKHCGGFTQVRQGSVLLQVTAE